MPEQDPYNNAELPLRRRSRRATFAMLLGSAVAAVSGAALAEEAITKGADSVPRLVPFKILSSEMWGDVVGDALEQNWGKITMMVGGATLAVVGARRKVEDVMDDEMHTTPTDLTRIDIAEADHNAHVDPHLPDAASWDPWNHGQHTSGNDGAQI